MTSNIVSIEPFGGGGGGGDGRLLEDGADPRPGLDGVGEPEGGLLQLD